MKIFQLNFIPRSADAALLVLRIWVGLSLLMLHGWGKLLKFNSLAGTFSDPLGVGSTVSLLLALMGEVVCAALLVMGAFTRFAALGCAITMGVAFWFVHQHKLSGAGNGELAFVYLAAFTTLFIAGGGRFALDAKLGAKG